MRLLCRARGVAIFLGHRSVYDRPVLLRIVYGTCKCKCDWHCNDLQHWLEDDDLDKILRNYDENEDGELLQTRLPVS